MIFRKDKWALRRIGKQYDKIVCDDICLGVVSVSSLLFAIRSSLSRLMKHPGGDF